MSMALGSGQATAALGGANSTSPIGKKGDVSPINPTPEIPSFVKTAGSIFGGMTHNAKPMKRRAINNVVAMQSGMVGGLAGGKPKPPNPAKNAPIGNMLAGNFGGLTTGADRAAGNMNQALNNAQEMNKDQQVTQTADEMLEIANNLTMKDMWAAA